MKDIEPEDEPYDVEEALATIEEILGPRPKDRPGPYSEDILDRRRYYVQVVSDTDFSQEDARRKVDKAITDLEIAAMNHANAVSRLQIIDLEIEKQNEFINSLEPEDLA